MLGRVSRPATAPAPVTLVIGSEAFLRERAVADILAAARRADADADVSWLSAPQTDPGQLLETLSPSLFAASRIAVVSELDHAADDLGGAALDLASGPPEGALLVLVHPGGVKGKRLVDDLRRRGVAEIRCDPLKRADDVLDFVVAEARSHRGTIDQDAARRLVDVLGTDLRALASMTEQLVADAAGPVDVHLVNLYVDGRADVKGWTIADLTVTGQADKALTELRWALAGGTDAVLVVGALAGSLRTLIRLSAMPRGYRDNDVARDLKVPSWKVRLLRGQLRGWSVAGLEHALRAVGHGDLAIKGGSTDHVLALSELVLAVSDCRDAQ